MRRNPPALAAALALAVASLAAFPFAASAAPAKTAAVKTYSVSLKEQNNSGAKGTAMLSLSGDRLTVNLQASGLVPNLPHVAHLHGTSTGGTFRCGTAKDDANDDGVVSTTEGAPHTGAVGISLTTRGDTAKSSALAVDRYPTADSRGNLSYQRTFTLAKEWTGQLSELLILQHGVDFNDNGDYDYNKGKSDLSGALPQEATAPATCGTVDVAATKLIPTGGVETGNEPADSLPLLALLGAASLAAAGALAFMLYRSAPVPVRVERD